MFISTNVVREHFGLASHQKSLGVSEGNMLYHIFPEEPASSLVKNCVEMFCLPSTSLSPYLCRKFYAECFPIRWNAFRENRNHFVFSIWIFLSLLWVKANAYVSYCDCWMNIAWYVRRKPLHPSRGCWSWMKMLSVLTYKARGESFNKILTGCEARSVAKFNLVLTVYPILTFCRKMISWFLTPS